MILSYYLWLYFQDIFQVSLQIELTYQKFICIFPVLQDLKAGDSSKLWLWACITLLIAIFEKLANL